MILPLLIAAALPSVLTPSQPFPQILSDALTTEFVAPGVTYYDYEMETKDGPLSVHVAAIDPRDPFVRIDTVLAHDTLVSAGETPSSMAQRTGAVAGINGDYFDINNTNAPLGIVVRSGTLVHTPDAHSGFAVTRARTPFLGPLAFSGTVTVATTALPLDGINVWPPRAGVSVITPALGSFGPNPDVTIAHLTVLDTAPATLARYRIDSTEPASRRFGKEYALAISPAAQQILGDPRPGDVVSIAQTSQPPIGDLAAAVGGGPLLLADGARTSEPDAPAAAEGRTRIPISALGVLADGTLLMVEVDGREPLHSIGLTRDEFTSLLLALRARSAVSLDGGGSSAIVIRRPGDERASLRNEPSDGSERPVADGLFVYSDAPVGPPARLAVRPSAIHALAGARVALSTVVTDAAGHPLGAPATQIVQTPDRGRAYTLRVSRANISAEVPVTVSDRPARIVLQPQHPNVRQAGDAIVFRATAYDRAGFALNLPERLAWSASAGTIEPNGRYRAGATNATVELRLGSAVARAAVTVGEHESELQLGTQWRFTTTPAGGPGAVVYGEPCPVCISLQYDFTGAYRGATMLGERPLPEDAIGVRFDVLGDGNGEILRVSLTNAINERVFLTAGKVDWNGWRTVDVRIPPNIAAPVRLRSIYVLSALGGEPVKVAGSIALRNARVLLAGK